LKKYAFWISLGEIIRPRLYYRHDSEKA